VKNLVPVLSLLEKAHREGARDGARAVLQRARDLSPTDTGASDKSGFVAVDDLTVQVGFRSLVSRLQHENLDWQHEGGGQAKFLEAAADQVDVAPYVAARIRAELG